ncbi:hypothetical protein [Mariniblastus fucicola]|uniref:Uncharacterized protein n=1 Tax=Mariniblastus fucicola TaxID=980251 RepID=A0A5B9PPD2_9BACT|nr:hypothetical protein [Mariniblastus fucicola]QEG24123.1 hypothetical protein MFFC18_40390 [Mariniblastus fucicola]
MRTAFLSLAVVSLCLVTAPAFAQQTPLEAKEKSVIRFDVNMDKIVNSELGKQLDLQDKMQTLPGVDPEEMDPSSISRVFGSLSLPDNVQAFQGMGPGAALPMELFSRVEFNNSESLSGLLKKMSEESEEVSIGGKTFMKQTDPDAPEGMLAQKIDDKTLEMGTEKYLTRADREVATDGLNKAWKMTPDHAVRIVVDVDGMAALKEEIIDMVAQTQPNAIAYAELLNNITNLRITVDLDGDELLTLCATGKDEELAEEFADGLDSLLMFGKMGLDPARAPNEEAASVMKKIGDALEAKLDGTEVSIRIPRPEGFNEVVGGLFPGF